MQRWHVPSVEASGKREPRVLFSSSACRAVMIDLKPGEEMGDHQVHERAVIEVVSGLVALTAEHEAEVECHPGTLITFEPGELHAVRALEASRILLLLAPWPGEGHYADDEAADPEHVPARVAVPPLEP